MSSLGLLFLPPPQLPVLPSSLYLSLFFFLSFEGDTRQGLYEPSYISSPQRMEFLSEEVTYLRYRNKGKMTGLLPSLPPDSR